MHDLLGKLNHDFLGNSISIGDSITWSMSARCGDCYYCKTAKLPQKCIKLFKYGHVSSEESPHFTGGYAKFIKIVSGSSVFKIPNDLSDEEAGKDHHVPLSQFSSYYDNNSSFNAILMSPGHTFKRLGIEWYDFSRVLLKSK